MSLLRILLAAIGVREGGDVVCGLLVLAGVAGQLVSAIAAGVNIRDGDGNHRGRDVHRYVLIRCFYLYLEQ